jgi:hypothetical protein
VLRYTRDGAIEVFDLPTIAQWWNAVAERSAHRRARWIAVAATEWAHRFVRTDRQAERRDASGGDMTEPERDCRSQRSVHQGHGLTAQLS